MSNVSAKVLKGSFLSLLIKFIQKSLGLISTLILARILTPDDFSVVAISALILHFCEVLSTAGSESYLIQKPELSKDDINSSWTLELILKLLLWVILISCIPFISGFYEQEKLRNALLLSSCVLLLNAFKSPGIALLKKNLEYRKIFTLGIIQKITSFSVVIGFVLYSPSYWAIIVGDVISALVFVIGSYLIHSYRPKLCKLKIKEQLSFSKWILLKSGVGYARAQMDVFFVGKLFTASELGSYHLARHLSVMPSTDIIGPAIEPLLASFSKVKHDLNALNRQFYISFVVIVAIITPIAFYMWYYPETIIDLLLGKQWESAYSILSALSLLLFTFSVGQLLNPFCVAAGQVKAIFIYDLLSFIFIFICLLFFLDVTLYQFALLRGGLAFIPLIGMLYFISLRTELSLIKLLNLLLPFVVCAFLAVYCVSSSNYNTGNIITNLLVPVSLFFLLYFLLLAIGYKLHYKKYHEWQKITQLMEKGIALISPKKA